MRLPFPAAFAVLAAGFAAVGQSPKDQKSPGPIDVAVPHVSTDKGVKLDYDIVYVRAPRAGDKVHKRFFTDFSAPVTIEPGADLMLLHPDGSEETLVKGGNGSVTDPVVSLDGEWVYYVLLHNMVKASQWSPPREGADIYKMHLKTRRVVKLTNQRFSPNTGAADWSKDYRTPEKGKSHIETGVYNTGPCPLPGGRVVFISDRDGFRTAKGYPAICLQLFVMDDRDANLGDDETPTNLEKIGHLNLAGALHPVVLRDGRLMYSSLESQGARGDILWGVWTIHPDGTNWNPLVSAFDPGGAPNGFHFQTQLGNGEIVVEEYYNQNNSGFGAYLKLPRPGYKPELAYYDPKSDLPNPLDLLKSRDPYPAFGPAHMADPRNPGWRFGRHDNGNPKTYRMPFMPVGSVSLTPFASGLEGPADRAVPGDKTSPAVGKFTHPSAAPNNHLLTCYSPGPANHQYTYLPQIDGGIYLIKNGAVVNEPAQMRLVKNDPDYNECWPRAVVPYQRVYGMKEPVRREPLKNNGAFSKHLPEGTPFALVGTSSFTKRESYPNGLLAKGAVTATTANPKDPWRGLDAFTSHGNGMPLNWHNQGGDAGLYANDDIHAVRVLAMEPTTDRRGANAGRRYHNHAGERLRVFGEIPLRKFSGGKEPLDPDGHPDTSFLAKIPADVGFTFQTIDRRGMVLNAAQTWHHLRPGEVRNDCGGCHAHSQKPTEFRLTAAAKPDYQVWDLVNTTPVVTAKAADASKQTWDATGETGLRFATGGPLNVEYHRDIRPILARSCAACHSGENPAAKLNLDADADQVQRENLGKFPGTYYRLALDEGAKFGHKPPTYDSWGYPNASRYVRKFQSRRSLLTWKVHGERLDGFTNDDHPSESEPGSKNLTQRGEPVDPQKNRARYDIDFVGTVMPPPGAVKAGKVAALTDEDRRTLARWIDLGCPIDLDFDPKEPAKRGYGWMLDEQRPTLAVTLPRAGANPDLSRVVVGMHDYGTGLNPGTFRVTVDVPLGGVPAGENLASNFKPSADGVWEWRVSDPPAALHSATLTVSVADRQGNVTRMERRFRVGK